MSASEGTGQNDATDAEVIRHVLDGHRDEFGLLIRRYQDAFHRFALGMVKDHDAATDLVQDTFVKAYTTLDSCRDPSRFESWAYQILRNRCRDYLKDLRRSHASLEDQRGLVSEGRGPEGDLERAELRRDLENALEQLSEGHREAFLLKHLHGHTYPEIAEILDASVSAVKMRVHRSRELLQEYLESRLASREGPPSERDVTGRALHSSLELKEWNATHRTTRAEA